MINFSKNIDPCVSPSRERGSQFLLKRINTVIISPYRGRSRNNSQLFILRLVRTLSLLQGRLHEKRLSRRVTQGKLGKETIPYRTCSAPLYPFLPFLSFFFFFFPPDLFSAIAIMAHRDSHARRRWQIRKERPFKLECDPWDGPPSTVINMQSKALRSIPAKETRRVGLYPVTVPSKKRVTRMTVVSWKSIINGEFIRRIQENAVCGYPIFDRCGLF